MSDEANPVDDLATQLQGRLQTLEVLMILLLREKSSAGRILAQASSILDGQESAGIEGATPVQVDGIIRMMNAARFSLDAISDNVRRGTRR